MVSKINPSDFETFLLNLSKTLSRINLYSLNHPMVKESVNGTYASLLKLLSDNKDITIAWAEDRLLLNGEPLEGTGSTQSPLGSFFQKNQLHSMTFKKGLSPEEMISFFKLFTGKQDYIKDTQSLKSFLENENVINIQINAAFFSKVTEETGPTEGTGTLPSSTPSSEDSTSRIIQQMESMTLDKMLWEIIKRSVEKPEDQKKIYDIIFKKISDDLDSHVENATRLIKMEKQQISNEKERTETIINQMAEGIVVVDDEGKIVMMNPSAEKIYGSSLSDLKGKKVEDVINQELMLTLSKDIVNPKDREISKELTVQSDEKTQHTLRHSTAKIKNPEGKVVGMLSILNDIAKQRELQRIQDDFVAHVTHELRTPLTAIKAALGTIFDDPDIRTNPQHKQVLSIAERNIDRLSRLITDILDFGKVKAGKISLHLNPIETEPFLRETIQSLQSWAQTKQINIILTKTQSIPKIMADQDRITQILVNLISNAIKFSPRNGNIIIKTESSPLSLKILITDSGPGITAKDQKRIFEKFFQSKQPEKTDAPGTGLGLYITKNLVDLHGGEIGFESKEGKGSTFYFTLPIVKETEQTQSKQSTAEQKPQKRKSWFSRLFGG